MEENLTNENLEATESAEKIVLTPSMLLFQVMRDWNITDLNWFPKIFDAAYIDFIDRMCNAGYLNKN